MNDSEKSLKVFSAFKTDIGIKRNQNQDSGILCPELNLFIVADGMGGHQGGQTASQTCVTTMVEYIKTHHEQSDSDSILLHQALLVANEAVYTLSQEEALLRGMGTTLTAIKITGRTATIIQVGDSRAYLWNTDGLWQLTRDHSLVQEKLRAGLIQRSQLKTDDAKNVITRSVGYEPHTKADIFTIEVEKGDGLLLCSDGLSGPVEDSLMFDILEETLGSEVDSEDALQKAVDKLIEEANARGGDDNITVALIKVCG